MSSSAWVVTCTGCKCVITCFAIDPQLEHGRIKEEIRPLAPSAVLTCPCCGSAYRYSGSDIVRGIPRRNPMCQRKQPPPTQEDAPWKVIYLGACLIAAVRLAREEDWGNSPRVVSRISDSINMAKRIYDRMKDELRLA